MLCQVAHAEVIPDELSRCGRLFYKRRLSSKRACSRRETYDQVNPFLFQGLRRYACVS
jgi:hypothetical protein